VSSVLDNTQGGCLESNTKTDMTIFDTRNEMLKYYSHIISNVGFIDAVDLFEGQTSSGDANGNNVVYYDVGQSYLELANKYKDVPNVRLFKSRSDTFLQNQPDNTYDIIYIDGDHSYSGVKTDLQNAHKKIKSGGYIMGHDYEMNMQKANHIYNFGVKQAVDEFCETYNCKIISKAMDGCVSYCIQVFTPLHISE
jgi:hypothetical protein